MNAEHGEENVQVKPHAYAHRWSCFLRRSDGFWTFSPCKLYEKFIDAISRLMRPKTKQFAVKFRRILELLRLQGL